MITARTPGQRIERMWVACGPRRVRCGRRTLDTTRATLHNARRALTPHPVQTTAAGHPQPSTTHAWDHDDDRCTPRPDGGTVQP